MNTTIFSLEIESLVKEQVDLKCRIAGLERALQTVTNLNLRLTEKWKDAQMKIEQLEAQIELAQSQIT